MSRILPWLILMVGIAQPLAGGLAAMTGLGTPIGAATAGTDAPEQPLPAFFSIWGVIFLAYAAFGLGAILRPQTWIAPAGWPLLIAGLANILWMVSAQLVVSQPLDFLLLAPVFAAAWIAAARVERAREAAPGLDVHLADAASGLLAGWIAVAAAISVPLTIRTFTGLGPTDHPWPMFWTTFAIEAAASWLFAGRVSRSPWFFAAIGWGLLGIALNNWLRTGLHFIALMAAAGTVTILLLRVTRGPKHSKPAA